MTVVIPATVKVLLGRNRELARAATTYLGLGAVHNGRVLAQYAMQLISCALKGQ